MRESKKNRNWQNASLVFMAISIAGVIGLAANKIEKTYFSESFWRKMPLVPRVYDKTEISQILKTAKSAKERMAPTEQVRIGDKTLQVQYSIDEKFQAEVEKILKSGKIHFGAFAAIDPTTGRVLALASHGIPGENLALRATFPAASIFKTITAAAAIENGRLSANSLIPVRGGFHTLYKQNIFKAGGLNPTGMPRYLRLISFSDAYAKSVNSVFGKVGIFGVGSEGLRRVAGKFQFGQPIPFELPIDTSQALIPEDEFGIAESASGFTRKNTLSPLHGAMIAAAIANGGVMMEPSIVEHVLDETGKPVYNFEPRVLSQSTDENTSNQLAQMMRRTVMNGTSRRTFRGANRSMALSEAFIGGKTGTLDGANPTGRYDWFVGFAEKDGKKIAIAALSIHGPLRGIKSTMVARRALETYFSMSSM